MCFICSLLSVTRLSYTYFACTDVWLFAWPSTRGMGNIFPSSDNGDVITYRFSRTRINLYQGIYPILKITMADPMESNSKIFKTATGIFIHKHSKLKAIEQLPFMPRKIVESYLESHHMTFRIQKSPTPLGLRVYIGSAQGHVPFPSPHTHTLLRSWWRSFLSD